MKIIKNYYYYYFSLFNYRSVDYSCGGGGGSRVQDLLPVFDSFGFKKMSPPAMKTIKPSGVREREFGIKK